VAPARAISIDVKGLAELTRGMHSLVGSIDEASGDAFYDLAQIARAETAAKVPHRSGRLAASAAARRDAAGNTASVGIGDGVPYAGWIEFGGGKDPQHAGRKYIKRGRYLYPTARRTARELRPVAELTARQQIKRQHWPTPH